MNDIDNFKADYEAWKEQQKDIEETGNDGTTLDVQQATDLGMLHPEEAPQQDETPLPDYSQREDERQYQKLGWKTGGDIAKAMLSESSKIFVPKRTEEKSFSNWISDTFYGGKSEEDYKLTAYQPKTKCADGIQTAWRYLVPVGLTLATAGLGGEAMIAAGMANGSKNLVVGGNILAKALGAKNIFKAGANASRLAKFGVGFGNLATTGAGASALYAGLLENGEERVADAFGYTENPWLKALQSDGTDTRTERRTKAVVEDFLMGIGVGGAFKGLHSLWNSITRGTAKNLTRIKTVSAKIADGTATEDEVLDGLFAHINVNKIAEKTDLIANVKEVFDIATQNGVDGTKVIHNKFLAKDIPDAIQIYKIFEQGEEPFLYSDGTFGLAIKTGKDAYKVSSEEYAKQMKDIGDGNATAINHMDEMVKSTWAQRGLFNKNEGGLFRVNSKGAVTENIDTKVVTRITDHYKEKFEIPNNIKVDFVDGSEMVDKKTGKALEAYTEPSRVKSKKGQPDITIKINKNTPNPYATLRSELEHARDIAKGEVPKKAHIEGSGEHFARYVGDNEGEVAPGYVHKKSTSRAIDALEDMNNKPSGSFRYTSENDIKTYNNFQKWHKDTESEAKLGDILNFDFLKNEKELEGFENIPIKHDNTKGDFANTKMLNSQGEELVYGGRRHIDFDKGEVIIYVDKTLSEEDVKRTILHELGHIRQDLEAYTHGVDSPEWLKHKELVTAAHDSAVMSDALAQEYNLLEKEADLYAEHWLEKEKAHYAQEKANLRNYIGNVSNPHSKGEVSLQRTGGEQPSQGQSVKTTSREGRIDGRRSLQESESNGKQGYIEEVGTNEPTTPDFSSRIAEKQTSEEITEAISNGELKVTSNSEGASVIENIIAKDEKISQATLEEALADEDFIAKIASNPDYTKEILGNDVSHLLTIFKREKAYAEIVNTCLEKLNSLSNDIDTNAEEIGNILTVINNFGNFIKEAGSAAGLGLQQHNTFKEMFNDTWASSKTYETLKQGISDFSEFLAETFEGLRLNFTRGDFSLQQAREKIIGDILSYNNGIFRELFGVKGIEEEVNKLINELAVSNQPIPASRIAHLLQVKGLRPMLEQVREVIKFGDTTKPNKIAETLMGLKNTTEEKLGSFDSIGGMLGYYKSNLLSGFRTLFNNTISGIFQTGLNPAKKIIGGCIGNMIEKGAGDSYIREGWNTYKSLIGSIGDSLELAINFFKKGEDALSDFSKDTLNIEQNSKFLLDLTAEDKTPADVIANIITIMPRFLGASDTFLRQLNYRSIARSKAIEQASEIAEKYGVTDENKILEYTESIFKSFFNEEGGATNPEILYEVQKMIYQNDLKGTIQMPDGAIHEMRSQTALMKKLNGIYNLSQNGVWGYFLPFVKTGANILNEQAESSLAYNILSKEQRRLLFEKTPTPEGMMLKAQTAMGTLSYLGAMALALNGGITGSPPADSKVRSTLYKTGWRPYSIRFGDVYVSYQGLDPLAYTLQAAADTIYSLTAVKRTSEEESSFISEKTLEFAHLIATNYLDKAAFRNGIEQMNVLFNLDTKTKDGIAQAIAPTVSGFLPYSTGVKDLSTIGKTNITMPHGFKERTFNKYLNRGLGEAQRDAFGNKIDLFSIAIGKGTEIDTSPEMEELNRLALKGWKPSEISDNISEDLTLNFSQFKDPSTGISAKELMLDELSKLPLREEVKALILSPDYQMADDGVNIAENKDQGWKYTSVDKDSKAGMLKEIFVDYNTEARNIVIEKYGTTLVNEQGEILEQYADKARLNKEIDRNKYRLQQLNDLY